MVHQRKSERAREAGLVTWEEFKRMFLDSFFPLELREAKIQESINLRQRGMSMRENALKFTKLFKYASFMVADHRAWMSKFISRVSDLVSKECKMAMMIKEMDISKVVVLCRAN